MNGALWTLEPPVESCPLPFLVYAPFYIPDPNHNTIRCTPKEITGTAL